MKVAVPLARHVLVPLGITVAALGIEAGIRKKDIWFWNNNFNNDIMKSLQALESSNILLKGIT